MTDGETTRKQAIKDLSEDALGFGGAEAEGQQVEHLGLQQRELIWPLALHQARLEPRGTRVAAIRQRAHQNGRLRKRRGVPAVRNDGVGVLESLKHVEGSDRKAAQRNDTAVSIAVQHIEF